MNKHYEENGYPIKCYICKHLSFYLNVVGIIEGHICEYEMRCDWCHELVAYWAYGNFDPAYYEGL